MPITFNTRGDSFTPRVNGAGGPEFGLYWFNYPATTNEVSIINSSNGIGTGYWDLGKGGITSGRVHYRGVDNWPTTAKFSLLMSVNFQSLSATRQGLSFCGSGGRYGVRGAGISWDINNTEIRLSGGNERGITIFNITSFTHGGLSTSTWYDLVFTSLLDGTTNDTEVFLDGVSLGTTTANTTVEDPRLETHNDLVFGYAYAQDASHYWCREIVIWDEIIDPTNVTLDSGTGSLNGASRTSYVASTPNDGSAGGGGGRVIKTL